MKYSTILNTVALAAVTSAAPATDSKTGILVASFDGFVHSVNLENSAGKYTLTTINKTTGCGGTPTWLALEYAQQRLWCLDEGWNTVNGSLNTFDVEDGLTLRPTQHRNVSAGPVQSKFFAGGSKIAVAQFGGAPGSNIGGGLTLHSINPDGTLKEGFTNITFDALTKAGPQPSQDVPRGHGVVLDPTGRNLLVTDYGADKLRIFHHVNNALVAGPEMETSPGSGPRHARFYASPNNGTNYLFVLSEFANTITTYNVSYGAGLTMSLTPPSRVIDTFGGDASADTKNTSRAGEIQISPDKRFVIVGNRLDKFTPTSDSLSTFAINADGSLKFIQRVAIGGTAPRHFTLNKAGDKVLVSLTANSTIAVFARDIKSGMIDGKALATLAIDTKAAGATENAGIPAAIWYE